jgi:hypothetical protein
MRSPMRSRLNRFRLSPAFPISLMALFVALGGIGYAAATVGTGDIKNGAVTSKKIKNGTIKKKDLKFTIPTGGAQGPAGPPGPPGSGTANVQADHLATIQSYNGTIGDPADPPASTVLASSDGFDWVLVCAESGGTLVGGVNVSAILAVNVSGGNNSHIQSPAGSGDDDDFDEGTANAVSMVSDDNPNQADQFGGGLIYGTAGGGSTQFGFGGVLNNPDDGQFTGNPDCVGSINLLAG